LRSNQLVQQCLHVSSRNIDKFGRNDADQRA
jgi:hypothetical protein